MPLEDYNLLKGIQKECRERFLAEVGRDIIFPYKKIIGMSLRGFHKKLEDAEWKMTNF